MDLKEKLYSKSSSLRGDKKVEYEAALDGYFRMKEDLMLMRTPISSKLLSLDLYNAHRTVESNVSVDEKKIAFINAIRLYISFVSSGLVDSEKERIKDEKWWSQEKMGTNRPPRTAPKYSSVEGWKK